MECFAKIVDAWKSLTIFVKDFILDVWQVSDYTSVLNSLTVIILLIRYHERMKLTKKYKIE